MKHITPLLSLLLLGAILFITVQTITSARLNQKNKADFAELNSVTYGLFSIDAWKERLVVIVNAEIEGLTISKETRDELRGPIAVVLNKMIDEAIAKVEKANSKTTGGRVKQFFIDAFIDVEDIKKGIPEYTEAVMRELNKPKTKKQIKTLLGDQVEEIAVTSTDVQDKSRRDRIVKELGVKNVEAARAKLGDSIAETQDLMVKQAAGLIALSLCIFALFAFTKTPGPTLFVALVLALASLQVAGVTTPMIDMEAKLSQLKFLLMGHPVVFEDQILYFQSKSIMDVFLLMIADDHIPMKFVAVLVVSFSVIFPILKLLATMAYYFDFRNARQRRSINFLVHKSGKWSMADVMVVAIFMAYIGFNGVIDSQLGELNIPNSGLDIIATNGTSLQPGFFLFSSFVLIAMLLSALLANRERLR